MNWTSICARRSPAGFGRRLARTAALGITLGAAGVSIEAADVAKPGMVDLGRTDPKLKGFQAPGGFRLDLVADESLLTSPVAMTFDDSGRLYVAEISPATRSFDVWEAVTLADGGRVKIHRRRKTTTDQIKRLTDLDGDGRFDQAEVVVEGVEQPSALLWIKGALHVAASGRVERWTDSDGDGQFETRAVVIDGFGGLDARGLTGLTLGADGYLYLTTGDNDSHAFTPSGNRVDLSRSGGLWRCRLDGSDLRLISSGFREPRGGVGFDAELQPVLIDDDGSDGSKLAGVRLIQPTEHGDYGWRTHPDRTASPDHELGGVDGDRPGILPGFGRLGPGAPSGFVVYGGTLLPEACRGLLVATNPARHQVRGIKLAQAGAVASLVGETTLLTADDRFCPIQVVTGADSALYVLDRREATPTAGPSGRIFRLSATTDAKPSPQLNKWERITSLTNEQLLFGVLPGPDHGAAARALRELVDRGPGSRPTLLAYAANSTLPGHVRLLGIQGARQFWNDEVEANMVNLLADARPEVRRLAAQALAWEPKRAEPRVVPRLLERLEDPDGRVIREVALALGRHGETNPRQPGAILVRWLYAHTSADRTTRDAVLRALERLGDVGIDEVALAVRTRRGTEREEAVRLYSALRSAHASEELLGLIKIPDLPGSERAVLIRQFADFPAEVNLPTTGLIDWVVKHPEVEPVVKLAALETCRLLGNPASNLVLACLDADDESVRIAATHFAAKTRPPGAMAILASRLGDDNRSDLERLSAARGLRAGGPSNFEALDAAYLGAEKPDFRRATLRSLADADRNKAMPALTSTLAGPDPSLRLEAVAILGETPAGALAVGKAYLDGTLTRPDLPAVLRALRPHSSKEARQTLADVRDHATRGPSALSPSSIRLQAVESGNPWAGWEVFTRASSQCIRCHQVGGQGGRVGPNLDLDAHGLSADKLIEAIQQPSRDIKPGFEAARLALADPATGSRAARAAGALAGVDRAQIGTDPAKRVAMPEGLDLELTPQELADLVAFLLDATVQGVVKQGGIAPVDRWAVAGPFAPGADSLRIPLDRFDPAKSLSGQGGRALSWLPLVATPTGQIKLGGLVGSEPGKAFAVAELQTKTAQTAWFYASTRSPARVYLNGVKLVDLPDRSAGAADETTPGGRTDLVRLTLKPGANVLLVAFDSPAAGEPVATFRLAATQPVEVRSPKK